jgi:septal ring factor EnvC (AmiA/AmiB activator)
MMCGKENKLWLVVLLSALFFCVVLGALQAEEPLYLISESELTNFEQLLTKSRTDKQIWLSLVQKLQEESAALRTEVSGLRKEAGSLKQSSATLNTQLLSQREQTKKWEQSFNESEHEKSILISRKDTEISRLETENAKVKGRVFLAVIITAAAVIGVQIAIKLLRALKVIPV